MRNLLKTFGIGIISASGDFEEKQKLIRGIARVFGEVAGEWMRDNTSIRIHEVKSGHWGGAASCWTSLALSSFGGAEQQPPMFAAQ